MFPDGKEMAEEYDEKTSELLGKWLLLRSIGACRDVSSPRVGRSQQETQKLKRLRQLRQDNPGSKMRALVASEAITSLRGGQDGGSSQWGFGMEAADRAVWRDP